MVFYKTDGQNWQMNVINNKHNHEMTDNDSQPAHRRQEMNENMLELIDKTTKNGEFLSLSCLIRFV